jgi:hypothetical protein
MNILNLTNSDRKWYEIVLWWEIRRIPYNLILFAIGLLSFYICFVTIPIFYLVIGLILNLLYTLGWVIELLFIRKDKDEMKKMKYPKLTYLWFLAFSSIFVLGISIFLLIR